MADNLSKTEWEAGTEVVSTDIAGVHTPHVKVAFGGTGVSTPVQDTTTGALPIKFRSAYTVTETSTTPLGISAVYTSAAFNTEDNGFGLTFLFVADQAATLDLIESHDNVTYYLSDTAPYPGGSYVFSEMHVAHAKYFKIRVTNGATGMTSMTLQVIQRHDGVPWKFKLDENGNAVTQGTDAPWTVAGEKGNNAGAPESNMMPVIGHIVQSATPTYTSGFAALPTLNTSGDQRITLDGESVAVTGTFWQATQPVSGTFWQATQPVSGTVTSANTAGDVAHGTANSGNPVQIGGVARSANPTAEASGDRVAQFMDLEGRAVTQPYGPRGLTVHQTTTFTTTTEATILTAGAAGIFHDICGITLTNTSAVDTRADIRDATAGTIRFSLNIKAGQTVGFMPPLPVTQSTAANAWTLQLSTAVTDVRAFIIGVKKTG